MSAENKRRVLTVAELNRITKEAIEQGCGDATVFFDTEARAFDCHLVELASAVLETDPELVEMTRPGASGVMILTTQYH